MSREAMKLALDYIVANNKNSQFFLVPESNLNKTVTALKQALAEPEQEPVGHADLGINNIYIFNELEPRAVPAGRTPLYTAPTPRKPEQK